MPTVTLFFAKTIALDLTLRQTLNAKIKFLSVFLFGFLFETIFKFFFVIILLSGLWKRSVLKFEIK